MSSELLPRDLAKAALAYRAHQSARCAHPAQHGNCSCGDDEFRRQWYVSRGYELCPECLGAKEVVVDRPPDGPVWERCPRCDGRGAVPPPSADDDAVDGEAEEVGDDGLPAGPTA